MTSIVKKDPDLLCWFFLRFSRGFDPSIIGGECDEDGENDWLTFAYNLVGTTCERAEGSVKDRFVDKPVRGWKKFGREAELISRYKKFKEKVSFESFKSEGCRAFKEWCYHWLKTPRQNTITLSCGRCLLYDSK